METFTTRNQKQPGNGYTFSNTNIQDQRTVEAGGDIPAKEDYQKSGVDSVEDLVNDEAFANLDNKRADSTQYDEREDE